MMQSNSSNNCVHRFNIEILNPFIIFHSSAKLIASDSGIDEVFKSIHQSFLAKIKNYVCEDCIVLNVIIRMALRFLALKWR